MFCYSELCVNNSLFLTVLTCSSCSFFVGASKTRDLHGPNY